MSDQTDDARAAEVADLVELHRSREREAVSLLNKRIADGLRQVSLELGQGAPGQHFAHMAAESVGMTQVRQEQRTHGVLVQRREVVGLEERVDDDLPVHGARDAPRLVVVIAREAVACELMRQTAQMVIRMAAPPRKLRCLYIRWYRPLLD